MPLQRRLPKRGFRRLQSNQRERDTIAVVNLNRLADFAAGSTVDPPSLVAAGLARVGARIKVLGEGELGAALTIRAHAFSKGAQEKIAAAGGTAEIIEAI